MNGSFAAVIAAAGLSSRMGEFKPLLPFAGTTVLRRCAENLLEAGAAELVAVVGYRGAEAAASLDGLSVTVAENPDYAVTQMFDSLRIGLSALRGSYDRLLLTPGDVPWVSPALIGALLTAEADFVCPLYGEKRGHPAALNARRLPELLAYDGTGGLRGAVEALGFSTAFVETPEVGVTLDLDTPEDYRRLLALTEK